MLQTVHTGGFNRRAAVPVSRAVCAGGRGVAEVGGGPGVADDVFGLPLRERLLQLSSPHRAVLGAQPSKHHNAPSWSKKNSESSESIWEGLHKSKSLMDEEKRMNPLCGAPLPNTRLESRLHTGPNKRHTPRNCGPKNLHTP